MATVYIGNAVCNEFGTAKGGDPGNQTGNELRRQKWYDNKKGWRVFRARSVAVAQQIAAAMRAACDNMAIGYDQSTRNTLYTLASKVEFDPARVTTPCNTDCSALVRVCCAFAGIKMRDFNTATEAARLLATGQFVELTDSKYTDQAAYLCEGDILVTRTKGHTAVVLNNGNKAEREENDDPTPTPSGAYVFKRLLKYGCKGEDVNELKKLLIAHGYDTGITVDTETSGNFGGSTRKMVKAYQSANNLTIDGIAGENTITALGGVWRG